MQIFRESTQRVTINFFICEAGFSCYGDIPHSETLHGVISHIKGILLAQEKYVIMHFPKAI